MNKEELVNAIASKASLTKKDAGKILDVLTDTIVESVAEGHKITLVGFGAFEARERKERLGRNPQTGNPITLPATKVPVFSAGKLFKEKVVESIKAAQKPQKAKVKKQK